MSQEDVGLHGTGPRGAEPRGSEPSDVDLPGSEPTDADLPGADISLRVTVVSSWADIVGALLMDRLGAYAEASEAEGVTLVFYPGEEVPTASEVLTLLPDGMVADACVKVERRSVPRDWVEGWKDYFHPMVIGGVRVRPPWEPPLAATESLVDVVIDPGLGFGTGLHPTTRGTLTLLQGQGRPEGALVDAGTGSGILSIAAAKLGWCAVIAFDNDPIALRSARENVVRNKVDDRVEVHECDILEAPLAWFEGVTVLANMTLRPVSLLVGRLAGARPSRVVVSGILAGQQEARLVDEAAGHGFSVGRLLYEAEWVSMELLPGPGVEGA